MSSQPNGRFCRRRRLRVSALWLALGLFAKEGRSLEARASADAPSIPVRTAFVSTGTKCEDPREFFRLLQKNRPDVRDARQGETAIVLEVRLEERTGVTQGEVRLTSWDAVPALLQSVENAECHDVLSALALKTAMDPGLRAAPPPPAEPAPRSPSKPAERSDEPRRTTRVDVGQRVGVISPSSASRMWGLGLQVTVERTGSFWAPAARLAAYVAGSGIIDKGPEYAKLEWLDARLAGCPLLLELGRSLEVRPCAVLDVGRLGVSGVALPLTSTAHTLWMSGGADLALGWAATKTFLLGAEAAATFPFERPNFYFRRAGEDPVAYRTPPAVLMVTAGVNWRFQE